MAFNLIDAAKGYLTNAVISKASSMLGEDAGSTQKAMLGAIPMVLSGLINRAESPDGGSFLSGLLQQVTGGAAALPSTADAESGSALQGMMGNGASLVGSLFGDKGSLIAGALSQFAGVKSSSASGMMGMAGSVLMGLLGRQAATSGTGVSGLMSLLTDQKGAVQSAMPSGLSSLLGAVPGLGGMLGGLSGIGSGLAGTGAGLAGAAASAMSSAKTSVSDATRSIGGTGYVQPTREEDKAATGGGFGKLLPWVLLGLGALALFFMLRGCNGNSVGTAVTNSVTAVSGAASDAASSAGAAMDSAASGVGSAASSVGDAASDAASSATDAASDAASSVGDAASGAVVSLGAFAKRKLSSGVELNIPANGIESNLIKFIEDKGKAVDKTTWFNFDRLLFETGSSRLTTSSQEQVRNMAEILKAYPGVNIKLGGYTDNTGNASSNQRLSGERATAVMRSLAALGIASDRLEAEGYGQSNLVASNDTPEGRAQNRRIAVRVTKK